LYRNIINIVNVGILFFNCRLKKAGSAWIFKMVLSQAKASVKTKQQWGENDRHWLWSELGIGPIGFIGSGPFIQVMFSIREALNPVFNKYLTWLYQHMNLKAQNNISILVLWLWINKQFLKKIFKFKIDLNKNKNKLSNE
jgi:hypothetical protein